MVAAAASEVRESMAVATLDGRALLSSLVSESMDEVAPSRTDVSELS